MKICFFTENYYKGGLDNFLISLFNAWLDLKDELTLVSNNTHPGLETIAEKTVRPIAIKQYTYLFTGKFQQGQSSINFSRSFPVRAFFVLCFRILKYPVLLPWYLLSLAWFFRRSEFDRLMVVNGGYPASLLCRCAAIAWRLSGKRPLATFNFHSSAQKPPWHSSFPENLIDKAVIHSSAQIISVSNSCLNTLNNRKAFLGCSKLFFIYNGIEDPILRLANGGSKYKNQNTRDKYCLMLATYEVHKGHFYLLQAFKSVIQEFPHVQLKIYGFGKPHEKQRVLDEIKRQKLENNIMINDFTTETASLLANASIVVVPSQKYESFGLTIIEAMAFGIPVVTTDVGGMPEVLADTNAGYVCSKDNPEAFAVAIKNIFRDPCLASELGRNGRYAFEQRYTASKMARQYESIIKQ
jgi:glycosyltransferase involved in cell wall biosynthesis